MQSKKWQLNLYDLNRWGHNFLVFASPALIALLMALQSGQSIELAKGAVIYALYSSAIDLFRKAQAS